MLPHFNCRFNNRLVSSSRWHRLVAVLGLGVSLMVAGNTLQEQPAEAQLMSANPNQNNSAAALWSSASFPVENFQAYTSPFGYRSSISGSGSEFHSGLDMAAPEGSYIRNWWTGEVVEVSDSGNCGTSISIQSGGWTHTYCHMSGSVEIAGGVAYLVDRGGGIQIRAGQVIPTGARIGRVGMTGRTTGPHLHWTLKFNDELIDPARVLRAMYSAQQVARGGGG
jgi:murein DD-endopeptidase MepM/ murein hydrolase activator NlpD